VLSCLSLLIGRKIKTIPSFVWTLELVRSTYTQLSLPQFWGVSPQVLTDQDSSNDLRESLYKHVELLLSVSPFSLITFLTNSVFPEIQCHPRSAWSVVSIWVSCFYLCAAWKRLPTVSWGSSQGHFFLCLLFTILHCFLYKVCKQFFTYFVWFSSCLSQKIIPIEVHLSWTEMEV
jgi:hypothetical protein